MMPLRSASLIFCTSAAAMSVVFMASLPLPSAPWHPAHLALNIVSPAAVSAFAGALSRHVPAKSVPTNVNVPSCFIFVCMLSLLPDEFFNSAAEFHHTAAVPEHMPYSKCDQFAPEVR